MQMQTQHSLDIVIDASDLVWPFVQLVSQAPTCGGNDDIKDSYEYGLMSEALKSRARFILREESVWPFGRNTEDDNDVHFDSASGLYNFDDAGQMFTELARMYELATSSYPTSYFEKKRSIDMFLGKMTELVRSRS